MRWTQIKLAREASVSVSLVRAVEQGRAPASPAFVSACARALNVGVAELLEQPYHRRTRSEHEIHASIPPIRRELAAYRMQPLDDLPVVTAPVKPLSGQSWQGRFRSSARDHACGAGHSHGWNIALYQFRREEQTFTRQRS
jgi:transcriptional regulator with XRE-family HTH domain